MHWVEVDGYPLPVRIGGHPALEFCNTWAGWGEPPHSRREYLRDFDRLAVWAGYAGVVAADDVAELRRHAHRSPDAASAVLTSAREFRTQLYWLLRGPAGERAFAEVAALVERAACAAELVNGEDGAARWRLPRSLGLQLPLLATARAAGDLLTSPDRMRVRACPGEDCGWLFVDRRGRRRWCSMSSCGNRAKVRAYAQRQRPSD